MQLDAIDYRILDALQENGRLTNVELADRVGLSASPTLRRVKLLESAGIITGYRATLDRTSVALGLTIWVSISVNGQNTQEFSAFEEAIRSIPEVVSCDLVSGEVDFRLQVVVANQPAYEKLLVGTLLNLPGLKDIRSEFVLRSIKRSSKLPLNHLKS